MAPRRVESQGDEVDVRDLKATLSEHLGRVKDGATVTITEHGKPVARLVPVERIEPPEKLKPLIEAGLVTWSGLPPLPITHIRLKGDGPTGSQMISEGREDRF